MGFKAYQAHSFQVVWIYSMCSNQSSYASSNVMVRWWKRERDREFAKELTKQECKKNWSISGEVLFDRLITAKRQDECAYRSINQLMDNKRLVIRHFQALFDQSIDDKNDDLLNGNFTI